MATDGILSFSMASVVEDVLQQHGTRLSDIDLASRKAEEAALRRYEAAGWLRKMVGVVGAKDLPAEPSEEEFRLGLRSGLILCNVLNKIQPGAVPKVVESACDSVLIPDGAALSAYQYFENVRNFLVAVQELGLPNFEASDLEQGGKSARIVNCVLALKSYSDWKQTGGNGSWKFGGNLKPTNSTKCFVRKNSEPFSGSLSRNQSMNEKFLDVDDSSEMANRPLNMLVRAVLSDKNPDEVPMLVESMLSKVMEEFERRLASHNELVSCLLLEEEQQHATTQLRKVEYVRENSIRQEESKSRILKQQVLFDQQQRDIQELRHTLRTTKAGMQFMQMKYHEEFSNLGKHLHGLAHAASGYHRVLEENRKLYNQVQDLKGSIRVYCRVRPFLPGQPNRSSNVGHIEEGTITIITPSKYGKEGRKSFNFNKVFGPSATQEEVFSDTQPLIRSVLDGYNVCIFAYGQTGSGKTYTMSGPKELTEEGLGVNYRALSDLFLLSEQRKDTFCYDVSVQMIEIYNEQGLNVPDANLVPVASTSDVLELMNIGQRNRAVGATALNDRSSRSHSCLTVHVQGRDLTSGAVLRGCMHLVDLAGSERVDKSEVTGDRLKEAQHINKSLSALGDVIASLAQKSAHVPYRNSKLTQLLQDSLGGQAKTLMFVHISPEMDATGETISTLKFAERVATVELGAARKNKEGGGDVKELKEQIATLKAALARKEGGAEQLQLSRSNSPERRMMKAGGSSPLYSNRKVAGDMLGGNNNRRQPMEDVGNIEAWSNSTSTTPKRPALDLQELNSPPWPSVSSPGFSFQREDDRERGTGDWVDKVMVNKQDSLNGDENPLGHWEGDNRQLPELFYQRYLVDSKVYPEQSYNKLTVSKKESQDYDIHRSRFDMATTDDSDELEAATSDSSEPDLLWQFNLPKVTTTIPNGIGSKIKKPHPKMTKSPDLSAVHRSSITTVGPSPSRKVSNGFGPPLHRNGRQLGTFDGKRKTGNGKEKQTQARHRERGFLVAPGSGLVRHTVQYDEAIIPVARICTVVGPSATPLPRVVRGRAFPTDMGGGLTMPPIFVSVAVDGLKEASFTTNWIFRCKFDQQVFASWFARSVLVDRSADPDPIRCEQQIFLKKNIQTNPVDPIRAIRSDPAALDWSN
ncbi:Calponin homology domain [Macleaya cordata]|uniref:Calponin homology domain n=1 Tax=Macleaya cordata TaxID=56857 RepID=A0A200QAC6_MACCD|nr:Calponin homology domain [Macleaya cordata]